MRELLQDKEQLTESIQFLIEENTQYKRRLEEMKLLLDEAQETAKGICYLFKMEIIARNRSLPALYTYRTTEQNG